MGNPYVGEIRLFAGSFAPAGWAFCHGQTMPISENETLFQLIGTTYGGDGQETFNLPNLQSRVPLHMGTGPSGLTYQLGEMGGTETVTLTVNQIPIHSHAALASASGGSSPSSQNGVWAAMGQAGYAPYNFGDPGKTTMHAQSLSPTGGNQPHDNMLPFLTISFIISLFGVFPSQT
jgi:microcystin-dependent protein